MHQTLANATFQVVAGESRGSGFSFMHKAVVITNFHVVKTLVDLEKKKTLGLVTLVTESGQRLEAKILHADPKNDFVIMQITQQLPTGRVILQPSQNFAPSRGLKLIFSGYPHGFPQLLTSEAIISSPLDEGKFAIDGMVNGGNSGGPIIDRDSGEVVGIVTQRRYPMREEAEKFSEEISHLRSYLNHVKQHGYVEVMGVDFGEMAEMFGRSLQVISEMMSLNANSGIGIGFPIQPVIDAISLLNAQQAPH
ncbi:S1 family peptidase [Enterobacter hormaechei]|uniref:S1 family peptidase n=1 Tax=Enterobacter hormaechei TaxID=158836 RepID=UPI003314C5FB